MSTLFQCGRQFYSSYSESKKLDGSKYRYISAIDQRNHQYISNTSIKPQSFIYIQLYIKTVLFQAIPFSIRKQLSSI